jgi:hypothetical protein
VSLEDGVEVQWTPERNSEGAEVRSWQSGEEQIRSWTKVGTGYNTATAQICFSFCSQFLQQMILWHLRHLPWFPCSAFNITTFHISKLLFQLLPLSTDLFPLGKPFAVHDSRPIIFPGHFLPLSLPLLKSSLWCMVLIGIGGFQTSKDRFWAVKP